ncbi:NAD-dependent deacylase [Histidinibacterium aquaticum]|uniref:NAD-dependent protein deacylase n=1 Tax=Histidinibacterium aquaticum TaxID=2613962 RepID=A0A5J5GKS9_9RHOB|nr:NAD-dependent deacylase [Histidinibacterium aquaticum]KAA9008263.1 NAD-dependent deacylase [Histidinibacterium aquaticum]
MNIVILTGAGISAESGLGTFRDKGGIWSRYRIEDVATPEAHARDPAGVHAFYRMRREEAAKARPNAAHTALARLQSDRRHRVTLVTQNVDDLHEEAGARPLHMHGRLKGALCAACGHRWPAPMEMDETTPCPACGERTARPDVVWFGEMPHHLDEIDAALSEAELFAAIGTSGQVYPAAGFVEMATAYGARTVELTLEPSGAPFDERRLGPATETVPHWVTELLD